MCHVVVGGHMVEHMCDETEAHGDMVFIGGVYDTYEVQGNFMPLQGIELI